MPGRSPGSTTTFEVVTFEVVTFEVVTFGATTRWRQVGSTFEHVFDIMGV